MVQSWKIVFEQFFSKSLKQSAKTQKSLNSLIYSIPSKKNSREMFKCWIVHKFWTPIKWIGTYDQTDEVKGPEKIPENFSNVRNQNFCETSSLDAGKMFFKRKAAILFQT